MDTENKKSDFTFVIQGSFHPNTIYAIPYYLMYGDVMISTWKHSPPIMNNGVIRNINQHPFKNLQNFLKFYDKEELSEKLDFIVSDLPSKKYFFENQIYNAKNCFYQFKSTYLGLEQVKTKYCIKVRSDELYSNFDEIIRKTKECDGKKLITTNTFFRKNKNFPWHPSDHLVACRTDHMRNVYKRCIDYCKRGGFFSEEEIKRIKGNESWESWSYKTTLTKEKNFGAMRNSDDTLHELPPIWPEMILGMCHLLESGVFIDADFYPEIMKKNFDVVNNDFMGLVQVTHKVKKRPTKYVESSQPGLTCPEERVLSLNYSMDEIEN